MFTVKISDQYQTIYVSHMSFINFGPRYFQDTILKK